MWLPFLESISEDSKEPLDDLVGLVLSRQVRIVLAVNDDKPVALAGVRIWRRGSDLIGDIVWCSGKGRHTYQHLLTEIEELLKQAGCAMARPICPLGWTRDLKKQGYKLYHCIMEKEL